MRMAACGIDCSQCGSYKVTMEGTLEAAERLVDWYRSSGRIGPDEGAEAVLAKNPICKGCWDVTEDCFFKCGCCNRDFRVCCNQKQIIHCGECDEFPCDDYTKWLGWGDHHKKAMEHLLSLRSNT